MTAALPPDLARPRHGAATLADVLPGVAAALGVAVERDGLPPDPLGLTTALVVLRSGWVIVGSSTSLWPCRR